MPYTIFEEKPEIAKFLTKNQIGVLATSDSSGRPHAATIYFTVDTDLNIYFITKQDTTKYRNLTQNPQAALVVYEPITQTTVQVVGSASEVVDVATLNETFARILAISADTSESSIPPVSKVVGGEYKGFCIRPKTIRLAEYTKPEHGQYDGIFDSIVVADGKL